jgi:hypothetical protein
MQEGSAPVQTAERANHKLTRAAPKKDSTADQATPEGSVTAPLTPEVASNYVFVTATNASLTDMSAGTTTLVVADTDDSPSSSLTNIGFDFYFQGARFSQFSVNANGVLSLGATAQTASPYQPLAQAALSIITAYGGDQRTHAGNGKVHFKVIGAAPNRTLVVEWLNMQSNFNAGGTADLTYQARLSETTGAIEFVYGSMTMSAAGAADVESQDPNIGFSSNNTAGTVGSVTAAQSGAPPPSFDGASATAATNLYTAGTITVLNSAAQGSRRTFSFTPPTPTAPTGLTFTGVTAAAMTLNWTDSPNETLYAIYRSTDGINFSFFNTAALNATSINASGLNPSTNYFWQVYAVSEGALSTALAGSQATAAAGNIVSTGAGGLWSSPATWVGGVVPTSTDNVTIADGATVTIDVTTATCLNLTVGQGTSGILQYIATPASTLTVNGDATVAAGGTFTAGAGVLLTHILNIGGNSTASAATGSLTVNGTFDMNTTAGVTTNFFGNTNGTLSGAGATCDFFSMVGQKGTTQTAVLDVTRVITIGAPAASANRLSVTGGTIKISSATVATPWFGSQTITGANGKLWINNAAASLQCVGTGASATGSGSPTITGGLQIDAGTFGYGQGNNAMSIGGTLIMGGANATLNMFGSFTLAANSTFTMTAGNINIDPQNVTSLAATNNIFRFSGPNTVNFTGGTVTIVDPHAATGTGRAVSFSTNSGTYNMDGGTVRFGNGVSTTAGSVDGFDIDNWVANLFVELGNVIVDNTATNAATRFVRSNLAAGPFETDIIDTLTITGSGGSRFNLNGALVFVGSVVNNGTLDGTTAASRLYFGNTGTAGAYSGTGTSLVPLQSFDIDNPAGVVINPAVSQIVTLRVNLFDGTITNSNKLTIGNAAATTGIVQIGATGLLIPGGNFDQGPVWNLGTGGQIMIYAQESAARTTSFEINPTRILNLMAVDNVNTLTISGGDLSATSVAASPNNALQLTNGRVITGVNTFILPNAASVVTRTSGYVDGNLRKTYTATGSKVFEVGTANAYSPATMNVTTLTTNPSTLTVKAVQGAQPLLNPATSLLRYWTVTEGGDLAATMTFNYNDPPDVAGTEASYRVIRVTGGTAVNFPEVCPTGPCVDEAANTIVIPGVTNFSDWTAGEPAAPTAAPATISGRVTTTSGAPMGGVVMNLNGARSARTITDANGNYKFANVDTDNFYIVTPAIVNYQFSPASRSFSLLANITDAVFTGSLNSVITGNVIDMPEYFVRQHYLDFLNREPDDAGLNFWSDQIISCGNDFNCVERRTINVSAAFFKSIEFQKTGGLVDCLYRTSYDRAPLYKEFIPDAAIVGRDVVVGTPEWERTLTNNIQAFLDAWVQRPAFRAAYDNLTNARYVDTLISHTGVEFSAAERQTLISGLTDQTLTRAQVLQRVAQDQRFVDAKFNEVFVRMEYFGFLRRDADDAGFHFWLNKLNEFEGNFERAEMVKAFLVSGEYRDRFRQ